MLYSSGAESFVFIFYVSCVDLGAVFGQQTKQIDVTFTGCCVEGRIGFGAESQFDLNVCVVRQKFFGHQDVAVLDGHVQRQIALL